MWNYTVKKKKNKVPIHTLIVVNDLFWILKTTIISKILLRALLHKCLNIYSCKYKGFRVQGYSCPPCLPYRWSKSHRP